MGRQVYEDMYKSSPPDVPFMKGESRRTVTEITTKAGGLFWGIVLLVVGLLWLMASLNLIEVNLNIVWPLLILLGGTYLIITKLLR